MAEYHNREHFIPLRLSELVSLLSQDKDLTGQQREQFGQFCRLIAATFHFECHDRLTQLKDAYAPFDPDADTRTISPLSSEQRREQLARLEQEFTSLLERANFKRLSRQDIEAAVSGGSSNWGVNMEIDFDLFDSLEVFARGDVMCTRTRRRMSRLWREEEEKVPVYQRLVLLLKLRPHKRQEKSVNTEAVYLKFFKDIPKLDIEMLLPGARLQMPRLERGKLGASLFSAVAWIGYKIYMDIAIIAGAIATWNPIAFWGPLSLIAGYGYKQYYGYQTTKQTYSLMLTQSLYYQNLDNNVGVITRLLDEAEEQECKEAILAYFSMWRKASEQGWTSRDLDDYIELDLEGRANIKVDFEIDDALAKLERLSLVEKNGERYRARPIHTALETLDEAWDNYFKYNDPARKSTAISASA